VADDLLEAVQPAGRTARGFGVRSPQKSLRAVAGPALAQKTQKRASSPQLLEELDRIPVLLRR
jgi:hypothetical protein